MTNADSVMVSIICAAYNHEKYIREALDGMLMQKTDFPYEIVINDDASTDGTADIIREYANRYPDIIRPIYQTENQYSQGRSIAKTFLYPAARGKYFALCEGDDYWIDENKLQIQVDYLQAHPECTLCGHNSYRYYMKKDKKVLENPVKEEGEASAREIIMEPYKRWIATASIVGRREMFFDRPEFFSISPVGDLALRLYAFSQGTVYYFEKPMSIYRREVEGSWIIRSKGSNDTMIDYEYRSWKFLKEYDVYTEKKYHKYLKRRYQKHWENFKKRLDDYPNVKDNRYFKEMPLKYRMGKRFKYYHPKAYNCFRTLKQKMKK